VKRKIVRIDEKKCDGCGLCVDACLEGALQLVDGKAILVSESYCDGLGNCLPECPAGAIAIEEREASAFDEEAVKQQTVKKHIEAAPVEAPGEPACGCHAHVHAAEAVPGEASKAEAVPSEAATAGAVPGGEPERLACGCPGTSARIIERGERAGQSERTGPGVHGEREECTHSAAAPPLTPGLDSQLRQWPCQIKLVPVNAPYLDHARLLVAADCSAYAYASLHNDFMRGRITLIGCPKLDDIDYAGKLTEILKAHEIRNITVLRMEVPCCGGIVDAVRQALKNSGKVIPWRVVTIGTDGGIVED
jgi:NAD-dependent dihydropyrimidine dehydrogenase PreA subunit